MIFLGSDHGGFALKEFIKEKLFAQDIEYTDCGVFNEDSVDYPDIAEAVAVNVLENENSCGILFCGTGIGISIAANKIKGIRCAHVTDTYSAKMSKEHNNANIIALGGRITGCDLALEIVNAYLNASFAGGRHQNRVDKITNLEK